MSRKRANFLFRRMTEVYKTNLKNLKLELRAIGNIKV